ncbi:MAG: hypothetical protein WC529_00215 [Candidatus Margulisiibacteriota bacterium]
MKRLMAVLALLTMTLSAAYAMGSKPAAPKEDPKYKLEIMKMEIVPACEVSPEAKINAPQK